MQVLVELFLHTLNSVIAVAEVFKGTMLVASIEYDWALLGLRHDDTPHFVHCYECDVDLRERVLDIGRAKDGPEVAPSTLRTAPLL